MPNVSMNVIGRIARIGIVALAMLATAHHGGLFAQAPNEWVGTRVITKFGAVLRIKGRVVDNEKLETTPRGSQRCESRIYRVKQTNGPWLWIKDENSGAAGWVTAEWLIPVDQAIDYFTNEIRANPASSFAYIRRGYIWEDRKEYDIAIADYNEAIRLDPGSETGWVCRGNVWSDKKEYDKAIADYNEAIRLDPGSETGWVCRGMAWSAKKEYDKAIADYGEAIRLDPGYALAYIHRGIAWHAKKEYDKAIADYGEAIRLDPDSESGWVCRGNVWSDKKEYDKAIADYGEAIRLEPGYALAYINRGNAWSDKKDFDKAIADYGEAIRLEPKFASAHNNRGIAWRAKKEYDKAIADYGEAIRFDPKYANAYNNRGNVWRAKKEYDKAIADYGEAIRLDPKYAYPYYNRSVARIISRRGEVVEGFKTVLALEKGRGELSTYAVILGHLAARQASDEADARWFLENAGKLDAVAWPFPAVKFLRGDIDEVGLLALAVDDNKRTEARCFLGLDHALKGHKDEALAHFRWVRDHGTTSYVEYAIALAELDRLEGASGASPTTTTAPVVPDR